MSSRYGRNKRRQHRAQLAAANEKLNAADNTIAKLVTGGDWLKADGTFRPLSDLVSGVGSFEIVETHSARRIEKIAKLEVFFDDHRLRNFHEELMRRGPKDSRITVEWHGGVWWMDLLKADDQRERFGRNVIHMSTDYEMTLYALYNPDSKQQVFNHDHLHTHRPRVVWGKAEYAMDHRSVERIAL